MGVDGTGCLARGPAIGVVAEDLYGALAVAARLQQRGLTVQIARGPEPPQVRAQAVIADAGLHVGSPDAARVAARWTRWLRDQGCARVEQRVEPTLRGNPEACLQGMLTGSGYQDPLVIVSTAYPSAGDVCVDGHQVLPSSPGDRGVSVRRTLFGDGESRPVNLSAIGQAPGTLQASLEEEVRAGHRRFVFDAVGEDDLRVAAVATERLRQLGYDVLTCTSGAWLRYYPDLGTDGFVVVAVSSRNDLGDRQLHQVAASFADEGLVVSSEEVADSSTERLVDLCARYRVIALETTWRDATDLGRPAAVTGAAVRSLLDASLDAQNPCLGVVVSGGRTATEVIDRMDFEQLRPGNELEPLCPVVRLSGGPFDGMAVISKGSFVGSENTLVRLIRRIIGN